MKSDLIVSDEVEGGFAVKLESVHQASRQHLYP